MKKQIQCLAICLFCEHLLANEPVTRTYLVTEDPYAAVEVSLDPTSKGLKDPTIMIDPSKTVKMVVKRPVPKQIKSLPAQLSFKKLAVSGRIFTPRIEFDEDRLTVGRLDEPNEINVLDRLLQQLPRDEL